MAGFMSTDLRPGGILFVSISMKGHERLVSALLIAASVILLMA
jgi:hypothetical protein